MNWLKKRWVLFRNKIKLGFKKKYIDISIIRDDEDERVLLITNKDGKPIPLKKHKKKAVYFHTHDHKVIGGGNIVNGMLETHGFQIVLEK